MPDTDTRAARISAEAAQNRADSQRAWKEAHLEYIGNTPKEEVARVGYVVGFRAGLDDERRESRATIASLRVELEQTSIERDRLKTELAEAWREAFCCDDIKLDQPLAGVISDLQLDRERLAVERDNACGLLEAARRLGFAQQEEAT